MIARAAVGFVAALTCASFAGCGGAPGPAVVAPDEPIDNDASGQAPLSALEEYGPSQPAPAAAGPSVFVDHVEGDTPEHVGGTLAPAQDTVEECRPGGGVVKVRIQGTPESMRMTIDPTSSLQESMRGCVLEALSTFDVDRLFERPSPADRPSNFTAHVTLSW